MKHTGLKALPPRVNTVPARKTAALLTTHRIRGRQLQEIRERHFRLNPLCVMCACQGRTAAATELDHRLALGLGGTDTDDNRQGLCSDCHAEKTRADMAKMRGQR